MIQLVLVDPRGGSTSHTFDRAEITVGRSRDCELVVDSDLVGRRHLRLVEKAGQILVVDLGSANGVFVNGARVSAPMVLRQRDLVAVGDWTLSVSSAPGRSVAGYRLLERLEVDEVESWLAQRLSGAGEKVVVEVVGKDRCPPETLEPFYDRAKLAVRLRHPNVVELLDFGSDGTEVYQARQLVPKAHRLPEILDRVEKRGAQVPQRVAAQIAAHLCEGLQQAHDAGLVRKLLDAADVLVGLDGVTRLANLVPLAEAVEQDLERLMPHIRGLQSMAPETTVGKPTDARSNVFSAGAILYRLICGRYPFTRGNELETLQAISNSQAQHPRTERPDVQPELAHYLSVALFKEPERRWPSARTFGAALEAFLDAAGGGGAAAVAAWMEQLFPEEAPPRPEPAPAPPPARERREGLPPELRRWAAELKIFPPDLARTLGPWLRRVEVALGHAPNSAGTGDGEPDGVGGLSRRGSYERLLLSEWLLATEMPEEFLRRAAMDEHLFLELARKKPKGTRRAVALFDAGPSQLGTPRLAHLAALIVLAARAREAGDQFAYGLLRDPTRALFVEVSVAGVGALLDGRSALEADERDLGRWREALAPSRDEDLWLVGGPRLARLVAGTAIGRLEVTDVVEPGARRLLAAVERPGRARQSVTLDLPAAEACPRILRDPFGAAGGAVRHGKARIARASPLLVPQQGRRLLARSESGSLMALSVPNSPKLAPGHTRWFHPPTGEPLLAAGKPGRALLALTARANGLTLWGQGPSSRAGRPCTELSWKPTVELKPGLGPLFRTGGTEMMALVGDALLRLGERGGSSASLVCTGVAAVGWAWGGMAWLRRQPGGAEIDGPAAARRRLDGDGSFATFIVGSAGSGALAAQDRRGGWLLLHGNVVADALHEVRIAAPPGVVVGIGNVRSHAEPGLLVIEPSRRHLVAHGDGWALTLPSSNGPIASACSSQDGELAAWLSEGGEVGVFSFGYGRMLMRYLPDADLGPAKEKAKAEEGKGERRAAGT